MYIRFANSGFILPKKNLKLLTLAAEPLIFAPPYPSRAPRGEETAFELFSEYTAMTIFIVRLEWFESNHPHRTNTMRYNIIYER